MLAVSGTASASSGPPGHRAPARQAGFFRLAGVGMIPVARGGERFAPAFSRRLRRAAEGATIITAGRVAVTPMAAFDEVDFGRWEGWTRDEIAHGDADNYRRWQQEGEAFCY